jgi:hypothetical protein
MAPALDREVSKHIHPAGRNDKFELAVFVGVAAAA